MTSRQKSNIDEHAIAAWRSSRCKVCRWPVIERNANTVSRSMKRRTAVSMSVTASAATVRTATHASCFMIRLIAASGSKSGSADSAAWVSPHATMLSGPPAACRVAEWPGSLCRWAKRLAISAFTSLESRPSLAESKLRLKCADAIDAVMARVAIGVGASSLCIVAIAVVVAGCASAGAAVAADSCGVTSGDGRACSWA
eukprot:2756066-Prymnesium_polylepis.1